MGKTAFVTMTTREFALLSRLEGQCRCLLKGTDGYTRQSREAISETLAILARLRKPATP